MADNYLEKRMEEYRNGGSCSVVRRHKMPRKKNVWVKGCNCVAHLDIVRLLCNGGHQVYVTGAADYLKDDLKRTLAKTDIIPDLKYDSVIVNDGDITDTDSRIIFTVLAEKENLRDMGPYIIATSVNTIIYPLSEDGARLAKMVRFLVDPDEEVMTSQIIRVL